MFDLMLLYGFNFETKGFIYWLTKIRKPQLQLICPLNQPELAEVLADGHQIKYARVSTTVTEWDLVIELCLGKGIQAHKILAIAGGIGLATPFPNQVAEQREIAHSLGVVFYNFEEIANSLASHAYLFSGM